jgi:hypothetical protein
VFFGWTLFAPVTPLSAATLSFLVVETGEGEGPLEASARPGPAASSNFESSSLWETSLFDVFFEAGHIVSNSPILRMNRGGGADFPGKEAPHKEFPPEIRVDLDEAAASRADYFILALLAYPAGAAGRNAKPEGVSLRIYAAVRGGLPGEYRFVYEGTSPLETEAAGGKAAPGGRSAPPARAEEEQAKRLIRGLVPHIK